MSPKKKPQRSFTPKFLKPADGYCTEACPLTTRGTGYVPGEGCGTHRPVLLVGESPWFDEVAMGFPFAGAAGSMLARVLSLIGKSREDVRLDNAIRCAVPGMEAKKFPGALSACQYLDDHIREDRPKVIVPLGGTALSRVLQLGKVKNGGVENFHGTVTWSALHQAWIVPTYHPSHLQRGATNLMGVVAFDLTRAFEVAEGGWAPDPAVKVIDPPRDWFKRWAEDYIAAVRRDGPYAYPLAVDIETPEKGADEGTLIGTSEDASYQIDRVNVSCHPDEGVTVPATAAYWDLIKAVLEAGGVQYYWYKGYDYPRLVKAGAKIDPRMAWDCMWMWKALQSDLPAGLGFAAPFYSRYGAWKHLSESAPGEYAAVDGFQTRRVGDGCVSDLVSTGRWEVFHRHMHEFHRLVLQPSTDVGVPIDRTRLAAFKTDLDGKTRRLLGSLQECLPEDLLPCTPKQGLVRPPTAELHAAARTTKRDGTAKKDQPDPLKAELYTRARVVEKLVLREVLVCRTCGKQEVVRTHNCQSKLKGQEAATARPILETQTATVRRWYWQEPFNPDSPQQVMAYLLAKGHEPGKSKQTGNDAADRETLNRLWAQTGDPFYERMLQYRAVGKVRGTYVLGTEKRLDLNDRIHPTSTFKPSTMRLSQVNPNMQNCVRKGTLIEVLRDSAVHPKGIPIEEVRVGDWVYCFDAQRQLQLRQVTDTHQNGVRPLVRVYWYGSPRRPEQFTDLTPDHLVFLTDGTWKAAGALVRGDRIMSLARCRTGAYELLLPTGQVAVREHQFVWCVFHPHEDCEHVHHVNGQQRDNRPENLSGLTASRHLRGHNTGVGNGRWRAEWPADPKLRRKLASQESRERRRATDPEAFLRYQRESKRAWYQANRAKGCSNHRVSLVTPLEPDEVYDLTVDGLHNYIAGELCVHNCVADKGGADSLAAGFRMVVVARGREVEAGSEYADE